MRRIYLVPNIVTAFSLACGLFVIFKMNMTEPGASSEHLLRNSAILFLIAAVADLLDGAIARFIRAESEFGVQFDSLSDAVTFGVAPSVVVLKTLSVPSGTELSFFVTGAALVYSVCGVLRLVRFNVKTSEIKGDQKLISLHKKNFTGLPIPAAGIAAVSANLFLVSEDFQRWCHLSEEGRAAILACILALLGYFMVSRWKFPSLKSLHFQVPSFQLVFITVVLAVLTLYGTLYHFPVVFVAIPWLYLFTAWILSLVRVIGGKKCTSLEDFEPENDD